MYAQVIEVHRTAVGMGGVNRATGGPWIEMCPELQKLGLPTRLPTLGPLECMQMMMEIQNYMRRVVQDPDILLSRRGWRECFQVDPERPWTELFNWWGEYSHYIHEQGGGFTAGGKKLRDTNFHAASVEHLYESAQQYKGDDAFAELARAFCSEFASGMEAVHNDYDWFEKIREGGSATAAYQKFLSDIGVESALKLEVDHAGAAEEHEEVALLRPDSRYMKPYSLNEPFFANLKHKYAVNNQMRIDGLCAQAMEEQNGSFKPGARLDKLNRVALLVLRKYARGQRPTVTANLKKLAKAQVDRKLEVRKANVLIKLEKYREAYARSMVEWNVEVPTLEVYTAFLKSNKSHKDKVELTNTIYYAIRYGWGQDQCHTPQSGSKKCKLQGCCSSCASGYGKANSHGHMMKHVTVMLTMVKAGLIVKPRAPAMPDMEDRARTGDVTLGGGRTAFADKVTALKHAIWRAYMLDAELDPETYSRYVSVPEQKQNLVGMKIEMRVELEQEVDGQLEDFVHCFEGEITAVDEPNDKTAVRSVHGVRTKWAVATVKWDAEFVEWGEITYQALDPGKYADERHNGGWNILSQQYVVAVKCAEAQYAELREDWQKKSTPDGR
jgi:hypothetical protein